MESVAEMAAASSEADDPSASATMRAWRLRGSTRDANEGCCAAALSKERCAPDCALVHLTELGETGLQMTSGRLAHKFREHCNQVLARCSKDRAKEVLSQCADFGLNISQFNTSELREVMELLATTFESLEPAAMSRPLCRFAEVVAMMPCSCCPALPGAKHPVKKQARATKQKQSRRSSQDSEWKKERRFREELGSIRFDTPPSQSFITLAEMLRGGASEEEALRAALSAAQKDRSEASGGDPPRGAGC